MYAEFAHDPKVQKLSESDQRRYIMILCMRCGNGDVTLHDDDVTFVLRIDASEWAETKRVLMERNLIDDDNKPTAWHRRQYASDSSAPRVARHRALHKQVGNGDVTLQKRPVEAEAEADKEENTSVSSKLPTCPHLQILSLYSETLPTLPQPRIWEGAREKNLAARWRWVLSDLKAKGKPCEADDGLDFFRRLFGYVAESDFLTGRAGDWSADLGWIVKAENFAKILQGNYENKEKAAA